MAEHHAPVPGSSESLDALLTASIAVFGLQVPADWRLEARFFLGVVAEAAGLVLSADLGDRTEPAAVYHP